MATLCNTIFEEIFNSCRSVIIHDFNQIKCTSSDIRSDRSSPLLSFCSSSLQKVFDEMIKVLRKARYNGSIIFPKTIVCDKNTRINMAECISNSYAFKKKYITNNKNGEIMLTYPKMDENKKKNNSRIIFLPIDGMPSFLFGIQDIIITLAMQEFDEENSCSFKTVQVSCYNPFTMDLYHIHKDNGCILNGKKITNDNILKTTKHINTIFVNNYELPFSFNLNKVISISNMFSTSTSIFLSLCNLITTNINLIIYKKGREQLINELIDFCIEVLPVQLQTVGNHTLIGTNKIIDKITN